MGKKKATPAWLTVLEGLGISLGLYLLVQMLSALLLVKGTVGEGQTLPLLALGCAVSVLGGGMFVIRRSSLGPLPGGLCAAGCFALALLAVGAGGFGQVALTGSGGILLLVVLGSGVVTGLLSVRRKRPQRGKRSKRA